MSRFGFPRSKRLLTPKDFKAVFDDVVVKSGCPEFLLLATSSESPRIGFIISKKNVKRAVARNRIKRHFREQFRHHPELAKLDIIVMAKRGADKFDDEALTKITKRLLLKLNNRYQPAN